MLEEYLRDFAGCVIVVSHDRYFMDKIVDHLLVFNGQGDIRDFPGNYTQYREWKTIADSQQSATNAKQSVSQQKMVEHRAPSTDNRPKKKTFKERQEFAEVERAIAQLEEEKMAIESALCTGSLSADELTAKSIRLSVLNEELDEKTMRWLELSEIPD